MTVGIKWKREKFNSVEFFRRSENSVFLLRLLHDTLEITEKSTLEFESDRIH